MKSTFFAHDTFWNTPLPTEITLHSDNDRLMEFARWFTQATGAHINLNAWTISLYYKDAQTPYRPVGRRLENEVYGRRFRANSSPYLYPRHLEGHDSALTVNTFATSRQNVASKFWSRRERLRCYTTDSCPRTEKLQVLIKNSKIRNLSSLGLTQNCPS
jgi:hypothetical protein